MNSQRLQDNIVVIPYLDTRAGKPITGRPTRCANATYGLDTGSTVNIYAPFASQMDWDIAKWAKLCVLFSDRLELSYKNSKELNKIIDKDLPGRPKFKCKQIIVAGEAFDVFYRDIIECIKVLYSDPDFANFLVFAPEHHYTDEDQTVRLFHDMHTGQWWWDTQCLIKDCPGATIIPVIISSDKTQVTMFRNKSAYPPSRHAHILLAYLPTTHLEHIVNKASRHCTVANLYHACMSRILAPLKTAGIDGLMMSSGDGVQCHCHPLFVCFAGDYPEQLLATGVKAMECPKCDIPTEELGSNTAPFKICNLHAVLDALARVDDGDLAFVQACREAGIKPIIHPYWEDLPHANIFQAITPDVLHQIYQVKYAGFLLGIIINIRLPGNLASSRLLKAICGLLDFLYLAQYPCHSSETLLLLDEACALFYNNKDIFIDLGIRNNFNLPKLHSGRHYSTMIQTFGTTDNYNTEYTERLHIDLAKDAYHATNHKDEFTQMTKTALARYIAQQQNPNEAITRQCLEKLAAGIHLPFHAVPVHHKIKWLSTDAQGHGDLLVTVDSIHARPHRNAL
ncbi:hypothetical protein DFJ58DRAFT_720258 [Suillus subalutaceus]|uniref:uncharacterized protein n=1 Tax=Suillus subalutaceus TaxID=48586 RepID=UPI001B870D81|nr:uncharacterized protein DFJ58DRAFT_720258 [Suillus subalutaceus]KAG1817029.1 hypothetical protein DFJ58DRAFT_720258 [Suillus subalutaceus]